ncbi:hypothetical protein D3C76_1142030 [compost metagenome]
MQTIHGYTCAMQTGCQFTGEEDIGQLGAGVCFARVEAAGQGMIVQIELADFIGTGGYYDNPALFRRFQVIQQQAGKQEMPQMIHAQVPFITIGGKLAFDGNHTGIIHQHIQHRIGGFERFCKSTDACKRTQVTLH